MEAVTETKAAQEPQSTTHSDQDLVQELGTRIDALWHFGERIANEEGGPAMQRVWRDLERNELVRIRALKEIIARRLDKGEFLAGL